MTRCLESALEGQHLSKRVDPRMFGEVLTSGMTLRRRLSVSNFLRMGEMGLFAPNERVELLDGEIYTVSLPNPEHAGMVKRLAKLLEQTVGGDCIVSVQDPLILNDYRLTEPDIALLKPEPTF